MRAAREIALELQRLAVRDGAEVDDVQELSTSLTTPSRAAQAWIILPSESSAASATASDSVGCAWIGEIDFLDGVLVLARDGELVDQLRGVRADDVRAEDLAVLRVADDLHEAVGLARRARAAVRGEGELARPCTRASSPCTAAR